MDWQELSGNWVLIPPRPIASGASEAIAIIHFLGGAFVATAPQLTYRGLLEQFARQGYAVITTPFLNTLDHIAIAQDVLNKFENTLERLYKSQLRRCPSGSAKLSRNLPIYGIGHSMGCKLHLLIGSIFEVERAGNVFISFNNFTASEAIPVVEQISWVGANRHSPVLNFEFTPSPQETHRIIAENYQFRRNLLIKFKDDTLDQTVGLNKILQARFPGMITLQTLTGNHQTPLGQDVSWPIGQVFSPIDAIGQWFKQEIYRDFNELKKTILLWLNPLGTYK
jgi:hypothetical protein